MSTLVRTLRLASGPRGPGLLSRLLKADAAWRQSRRLSELDPRRLDDLGIAPGDVGHRETRWDAPAHWFL